MTTIAERPLRVRTLRELAVAVGTTVTWIHRRSIAPGFPPRHEEGWDLASVRAWLASSDAVLAVELESLAKDSAWRPLLRWHERRPKKRVTDAELAALCAGVDEVVAKLDTRLTEAQNALGVKGKPLGERGGGIVTRLLVDERAKALVTSSVFDRVQALLQARHDYVLFTIKRRRARELKQLEVAAAMKGKRLDENSRRSKARRRSAGHWSELKKVKAELEDAKNPVKALAQAIAAAKSSSSPSVPAPASSPAPSRAPREPVAKDQVHALKILREHQASGAYVPEKTFQQAFDAAGIGSCPRVTIAKLRDRDFDIETAPRESTSKGWRLK